MKKLALIALLAGFTTLSASADFNKCAGCHGKSAEKSALGKSQVIAGWSVDKLVSAMNGYKNGTYGGAMKNLMKGQLIRYNNSEIKALATHINGL